MNGYELSRQWWTFAADNVGKVKPTHTAIFYYAVEIWNYLGQPKTFGLPKVQATSIVNVTQKTFYAAYNDIVEWGFIIEVKKGKNQFEATIVELNGQVNFTEATTKAHTKAILQHQPEHYIGNYRSIDLSNDCSTDHGKTDIIELLNLETIKPQTINGAGVSKEILPIEKKIWAYFELNEITHFNQIKETGPFVTTLQNTGRLAEFETEFEAYREYKKLSQEREGTLRSFLGTPEKQYSDGRWCSTSWQKQLKDFKAKQNATNKTNFKPAITVGAERGKRFDY